MNEVGLELFVNVVGQLPEQDFVFCLRALCFAVKAHLGQMDHGDEPHIHHVLTVALEAAKFVRTCPEKFQNPGRFVAAAALHDVVEDTDVTLPQIQEEFGIGVAVHVLALSHIDEEEPDEEYLRRTAMAGWEALKLKSLDRIQNLRRLHRAPADFKAQKLIEVRASLAIWRELDAECAAEIETVLNEVEGEKSA